MDISLGNLNLSPHQRMRMHLLQTENVRSFCAIGGSNPEVIVTVINDLTAEEKDQLILDLVTLDDAPFVSAYEQDKVDFKQSSPFFNQGPSQASDWIEATVTDLDSAKLALKKMAEIIAVLVRRSDLNG